MLIHRPYSPGPIKKTKKEKKRPSLKVKAAKLKNKSLFATPTSSVSKKKKTKKTSKKRKASTSDSDSGPEDVINNAEEDIAFRAIDLLKEVFTHLGPKLQSSLTQFHKTFVGNCLDKLHNHYNTIGVPTKQNEGADEEVMIQNRILMK